MKGRLHRPILAAANLAPIVAILAAFGLMVVGVSLGLFNESQIRQQTLKEAGVQAGILAGSVTAALSFDAPRQAQQYVDALAANPEVEAAGVYDSSGKLVAGYLQGRGVAPPPTNRVGPPEMRANHIIVSRPVAEGGQVFGSVYLRTIQEPPGRRVARYSGIGLLIVMAALVLVVLGMGNASLSDANRRLQVEMIERERTEEALRLSREHEAAARIELADQHNREALQQSEQQLAFALEAGRLGSWEINLQTGRLQASEIFLQICRCANPDQLLDGLAGLEACIHPEDREPLRRGITQAAEQHTELEAECRIFAADGPMHWMLLRGRAAYDEAGRAVRIAGVSLDITERKAAEERQRLMLAELNHRVKNTLATVQSIAIQLGRMAPDVASFQGAFLQRIVALARIHDLLSSVSWKGAQLADVLQQTLAPHLATDGRGERIRLEGPPVQLGPNAAVTLTMAFHELATNAAKYGSLSVAGGQVQVRWASDDPQTPRQIDIEWREIGGPSVVEPARRGFGTRFIERGVAREFDGIVNLSFEPAGLICRLRIPLSLKFRMAA
jgi:two-component sensor histidine kinase